MEQGSLDGHKPAGEAVEHAAVQLRVACVPNVWHYRIGNP